ncbi:MAG: hypothetical protein ACMUIE_03535 [Thermoplasmatota archaeon]
MVESATFDPRMIIRDVIATLVRKPKLFVPLLLPLLVSVISEVGWRVIFHFYGYEDEIFGLEDGIVYLIIGWSALTALIGVLIGLIASAWAIKTYHIYHLHRRVELLKGLKYGMRFLWRMALVRLVVFLMLLIPITIPVNVMNLMIIGTMGTKNYSIWYYLFPRVPMQLITMMVMVFFAYIYQAVIIGRAGVFGSIKWSFIAARKNYIQTFVIMLLPILFTLPFLVLDLLLWTTGVRSSILRSFLNGWIPGILGFAASAVVIYSLTKGFLVSTTKKKEKESLWD